MHTILNCYSRLSFIKSAELIAKKKDEINPFTKENKDLLNIYKLVEKYDDEIKLAKELVKLKELIDISKEEVFFVNVGRRIEQCCFKTR